MKLSRVFQTLLPIPIFLLTSCQGWIRNAVQFELARIDREGDPGVLQTLRSDLARMQLELVQVEEHLTYCAEEVRSLLQKVQQECEQKLVCTSEAIDAAVLEYDPSHQGRFLSLMQDRRHQAFYLPTEPRALLSQEKKLLRDLVAPAWLDDRRRKTRFLIVSHPENESPAALERAKRRSLQFVEEIAGIAQEREHAASLAQLKEVAAPVADVRPPGGTTQGVSMAVKSPESKPSSQAVRLIREGRILHWVFPFETPRENIRLDDRPRAGDRISRSVWVYRVDC